MANKNIGQVGFQVDGKDYAIRFSADALANVEDAVDMPINAFMAKVTDMAKFRLSDVRTCFKFGVRDVQPDLEEKQITAMFRSLSAKRATEIVSEALSLAWQDATETENPPQPGGQK